MFDDGDAINLLKVALETGKKRSVSWRKQRPGSMSWASRTASGALVPIPVLVAIAKILTDFPAKLPDVAERDFLKEALACYRPTAPQWS